MGLGVPWLLYTLTPTAYMDDTHRYMYFGMAAGGVVFPVLVLIAALVLFIVLLICTGFKARRGAETRHAGWHLPCHWTSQV